MHQLMTKFSAQSSLKFTALQCVVSSEPRQLFKKCPGKPPYEINREIRTNGTKMKVLVYGYAFPGSGRIRLNTVLLNPVSLICLYLYQGIVNTSRQGARETSTFIKLILIVDSLLPHKKCLEQLVFHILPIFGLIFQSGIHSEVNDLRSNQNTQAQFRLMSVESLLESHAGSARSEWCQLDHFRSSRSKWIFLSL